MASDDAAPASGGSFSAKRVLALVLPLIAIVVGYAIYQRQSFQAEAQRHGEQLLLGTLGLNKPTQHRLDAQFTDANGDLVADPPQDAAKLVDPDPLVFSYVGGSDSERQQEVWKEFLDALAAATGKKVQYLVLSSPIEQLRALKEGKLHVAGINTGNVPTAVSSCGFVPVCTLGNSDGTFGYTMKIIVPTKSSIQSVQDLRGRRLALTDRQSNSGYKAPLVLLMYDFGLVPQRDFEWVITFGHDASIHGIASGEYEAAPVAGDMLARAISRDEITDGQFRVIYESERFPPAAMGYVYNLEPQLARHVAEAFSNFPWAGTGLETEFGPSNVNAFVPVSYKDHWALIRRIDDAMGTDYQVK